MIKKAKGFSLLEILVAFSIMAVALTIILRIFGSGVNNAVISEEYNIALQIAESIMARTGIETPLAVGQTDGVEGYKYHWLVTIDMAGQTPMAPPQTGGTDTQSTTLYLIKVLVVWGDDNREPRSLELQTLKSV